MYQIKLDKFEGPLDLLLKLIEEEKLGINEISLAQVANKYLDYVNKATDISIEELADFLAVTAKLILIKSRSLLPTLDLEEEEDNLVEQLKIYKEYYDASKKIEALSKSKNQSFCRLKPLKISEIKFSPPPKFSLYKLREIFEIVLKNLEFIQVMPQAAIEKTLNITEKIDHIKNLILKNIKINFSKILGRAKDKTEMIVSFLAILELIKQRVVTAGQDKIFEEITIEKK